MLYNKSGQQGDIKTENFAGFICNDFKINKIIL
jgi:hypothetical protein